MNNNEVSRLAHAINDHRPDWPISSLTTFIQRDLSHKTYRDASVALTWVATDTNIDGTHASEKPQRVLEAGPWWRAAAVENPTALTPTAPRRSEQCLDCGQHLDRCTCGNQVRAYKRGDAAAGAAAVRAALRGDQ